MNDFFLANNESLLHTFIDQKIEVKQIQVKNLDRFAQYANNIKDGLKSYSIETITPLVEPQILNIMGMCSLVTTMEPKTFEANTAQTRAIAELVLKIIQVNDAFFKKPERNRKTKGNAVSIEASWFDSFGFLVEHGHSETDIYNMSYGAFLEYIKSAQRRDNLKLKSIAIATRVANNAKQNGFEKYINSLGE
ncbi:hypothetical protein F909_03628 [Acinetobacter sp. ANC 3929]|uniref:hypothetical protein n=1 Tax=Acinetobacter sp. ANC 3929 TaxID=1217707 RepID=UPI0002D084E4|nr:hypothetical protein [Acinetobacter sp. ANC 3929]ENW78666.1 hypothetical protein F909_03628 [Acinetobacter sp. ANC 3929]